MQYVTVENFVLFLRKRSNEILQRNDFLCTKCILNLVQKHKVKTELFCDYRFPFNYIAMCCFFFHLMVSRSGVSVTLTLLKDFRLTQNIDKKAFFSKVFHLLITESGLKILKCLHSLSTSSHKFKPHLCN